MPIEKIASVRLKPYLYTSIWPFKIFGVKTLMGVERCEVHFLAILPFFGYIIKFLHVAWKITNPSHDDIYLRIFVKIFSEGRRQDFSSDHKVF